MYGGKIRDVNLSCRNVRILLLSHESLLYLHTRYIKDSCRKLIVHNIKNSGKVCQTEAVLQADFVYSIAYENVDSAEQEILTEYRLHLLRIPARDMARVKSEGLFFGARLPSR